MKRIVGLAAILIMFASTAAGANLTITSKQTCSTPTDSNGELYDTIKITGTLEQSCSGGDLKVEAKNRIILYPGGELLQNGQEYDGTRLEAPYIELNGTLNTYQNRPQLYVNATEKLLSDSFDFNGGPGGEIRIDAKRWRQYGEMVITGTGKDGPNGEFEPGEQGASLDGDVGKVTINAITANTDGGEGGCDGPFCESQGPGGEVMIDYQTSADGPQDITTNGQGYPDGKHSVEQVDYLDYVYNKPPEITAEIIDTPLIGEPLKAEATYSDPDGGVIENASIQVFDDGQSQALQFDDTLNTPSVTKTYTDIYTPTAGDISARFKARDSYTAKNTTVKFLNTTLVDTKPDLTLNKPTAALKDSNTLNYSFTVNSSGDDEPNESIDVELYRDGAQFDTRTVTGQGTATGTVTYSQDGSHTFNAKAVDDPGTVTKSVSFTTDTTPPQLNILEPGNRTDTTQGINLTFTATDATTAVETDTIQYARDGGTNISTTGNTTVNYGTTGSHTVSVFADDQAGNTGGTTKTFTADVKNTLKASTEVSNTGIGTFTATFSNATDTLRVNTTDGNLEFFTTELPKGDVNLEVNSQGFEPANQTLTNVDRSFNRDISISLARAGYSFNAFNEQEPTKELDPRTVEFSNGTTSQKLNKTRETSYGGSGFSVDENDGSYTTCCGFDPGGFDNKVILDESAPGITAKKIHFITSDSSTAFQDDVDAVVDVNGDRVAVTGFNGSADLTANLEEPKKVDNIRIEAGTDGSGGTWYSEFKRVVIEPPEKGEIEADYTLLKNTGFPIGDVTAKVESQGFQTREFQATVNGNTKTTLDTFLLPSNQGIRTSVEVLSPQREPVSNAQVTVQRRIDGVFKTVSQDETSTAGGASFFLDPNTQYQAVVNAPRFVGFEGTFNPANFEFEPFQIILSDASQFNFTTRLQSVSQRLEPGESSIQPNGTLNYTVIDSENEVGEFGIQVFNGSGGLLVEKVVTGSSTGGTVIQNLSLNDTKQIKAVGFFTTEGERFNFTKNYIVLTPFEVGDTSLAFAVQKFEATTGDITQSFVALFFVAITGIATGRQINRTGGGLIALTVLGGFTLVGFVNPAVFIITLIGVSAAVLFQ